MKKPWILCLGAVFALLLLGPYSAQAETPSLAKMISEKMDNAVVSYKQGRFADGALLLLDVVKMTRPEKAWPAGFDDEIDAVTAALKNNDLAGGTSHVKAALGIFRPGYSFPAANEEGPISNIAEAVLSKIQTAKNSFKIGDADAAVVQILESLLLLAPHGK
jgi:hypothetical protein